MYRRDEIIIAFLDKKKRDVQYIYFVNYNANLINITDTQDTK